MSHGQDMEIMGITISYNLVRGSGWYMLGNWPQIDRLYTLIWRSVIR